MHFTVFQYTDKTPLKKLIRYSHKVMKIEAILFLIEYILNEAL